MTDVHERERELERLYPTIAWREPVGVRLLNGSYHHYACRFCIALKGLYGADVPELPTDIEAVRQHISQEHL